MFSILNRGIWGAICAVFAAGLTFGSVFLAVMAFARGGSISSDMTSQTFMPFFIYPPIAAAVLGLIAGWTHPGLRGLVNATLGAILVDGGTAAYIWFLTSQRSLVYFPAWAAAAKLIPLVIVWILYSRFYDASPETTNAVEENR